MALLGISGVEGSKGTGIWLIMLFPLLFTVGMCLIDTMDGALMMSLYVAPMKLGGVGEEGTGSDGDTTDTLKETGEERELMAINTHESVHVQVGQPQDIDIEQAHPQTNSKVAPEDPSQTLSLDTNEDLSGKATSSVHLRAAVADPLPFLYYSFILTTLTVICAVVIGMDTATHAHSERLKSIRNVLEWRSESR